MSPITEYTIVKKIITDYIIVKKLSSLQRLLRTTSANPQI